VSLELINPDDLPIPEMYTQVVVATGSKLVFVSVSNPKTYTASSLGMVILRHKRASHSAISAERSVRQVHGLSKFARSQSTLSIIGAMNTFRSSEEAQISLFGDHKPANVVVGRSDNVPRLPHRGSTR
jgi:hypothetical protein